jgi:hypothetical protein
MPKTILLMSPASETHGLCFLYDAFRLLGERKVLRDVRLLTTDGPPHRATKGDTMSNFLVDFKLAKKPVDLFAAAKRARRAEMLDPSRQWPIDPLAYAGLKQRSQSLRAGRSF